MQNPEADSRGERERALAPEQQHCMLGYTGWAGSSDVGALLPGRRHVPMLALYHRKPFLLLKLGRCWNIWWNGPTGHLCDKWIKLNKVVLTATGLCLSQIRTRRHRCFILWMSYCDRRLFWLFFSHFIFEQQQKFIEKHCKLYIANTCKKTCNSIYWSE